jgi:hypothetical protein
LQRHFGELRSIRTGVRHLVRNNQMMLRVYRDLHVIANNP